MARSSSTRRAWVPRAWPADRAAAEALRAWLADPEPGGFVGNGLDFTGADFTGGDFVECWFGEAVLRRTTLRGAELTHAHVDGADLAEADLTEANLAGASADKLLLRECKLEETDLTGFTGTVLGPISVVLRGQRTLLDGDDLEQWFTARGARVSRFRPEP